jgi:hypothetical protein
MTDPISNSTQLPYPYLPDDNGAQTTEVPAGYVSDAELLLWLQAKSSSEYDKLRELMDLSQLRSKAIEDLSHLKNALDDAVNDPGAALAQIQTIEAAYAGTDLADDIAAVTGPMKDAIEDLAFAKGRYGALVADSENVDSEAISQAAGALQTAQSALSAQAVQSASDLGATIDALGRDDQLALIQIQDLMANVRQASQLTSNIVAGHAQTADGIVANIRA